MRDTQEGKLLELLERHPQGLTDAQMGEAMQLPKSQIAARRNGLKERFAAVKSTRTIRDVGVAKDPKTQKNVTVWALREAGSIQRSLFDS